MKRILHSAILAGFLSAVLIGVSIRLVAPVLSPFVGAPDYHSERTISLPATPSLRLENEDGDVEVLVVAADAGAEFHIEAKVLGFTTGSVSVADLERAAVTLFLTQQDANETVVLVNREEETPAGLDFIVHHTVRVPMGTNIEIVGGNGNIRVHDGAGIVKAHGVNADIRIEKPGGHIVAETVNGRIRVDGVMAEAQMQTVNGDIYAEILGGRTVAVSTNGGIHARVSGSDVEALNAKSAHGPVAIDIPEALGLTMAAIAPGGRLNGVDVQSAGDGTYTATFGDGGTALNLETTSGTITVRRRP